MSRAAPARIRWVRASTPVFSSPTTSGIPLTHSTRSNRFSTRPCLKVTSVETTHSFDYLDSYVSALPEIIDLEVIRESGLHIGADPMGSASVAYWQEIGERFGLDLTVVNPEVDPQWAFMTLDWDGKIRMDCSSPSAMASLIQQRDKYDIATGNDADADRHGIVTPDGGLMNPNHYLAVAIDYLYTHRSNWSPDAAVGAQFASLGTFGRGVYPLVLRLYRDHIHGELAHDELIASLEQLQSLLLRRTIVGVTTDRLVARLCRAAQLGRDELVHAIARITPSDERTRVGLKYSALPHARYVLGRMSGVGAEAGWDLEHIAPTAPGDDWSPDGIRRWAELSDDEQNSFRALAPTLGNLALLEESLFERAFDAAYPAKRAVYGDSALALTREVADAEVWSTAAIARRTEQLTERFLQVWRRPAVVSIDDDNLTPILDAKQRRGWPRGWEREFDYVEFRGEHWEVKDIRYLFHRIFQRLWAESPASRQSVMDFSARRGGPVYPAMAWNGQWDRLSADEDSPFLYMGWDSRYMLAAVQGVLEEAGWASEVFLKYSYIGDAMR